MQRILLFLLMLNVSYIVFGADELEIAPRNLRAVHQPMVINTESEFQEPNLWLIKHDSSKHAQIIGSVKSVMADWKKEYKEGKVQVAESNIQGFMNDLTEVAQWIASDLCIKNIVAELKKEYISHLASGSDEPICSELCKIETEFKSSGLSIFVQQQRMSLATLAVFMGANLDKRDEHGRTPFYVAMSYENNDLCTLLMNFGANMAIPTSCKFGEFEIGVTPLFQAAFIQGNALMEAIVDNHPALVNGRDIKGQTVLHYIASKSKTSNNSDLVGKVKFLLAHGADKNIEDNDGHKPIDVLALQSKYDENNVTLKKLLEAKDHGCFIS